MPFASVPCRNASEVDVKKPLARYIEKTYGAAMLDSVYPALDQLQNMRKAALARLNDKNMTAIKQIGTYHDTLYSLEPRVSMSENGARVDWKWSDFNGRSKKICSSEFERANLIFCFGAIHSQIAEGCDIKDESSLKQAVISLRTASGVFEYLANNVSMFGASNSDVTVDILSAYSIAMQAQAQECVFLKAEQGSIPSQMVAKIASKARQFYEDAVKRCNVPSCKHGIPKDWLSNLTAKAQLFNGLAQYYQAKACGDSRSYGEQVARLGCAYDLIKQAASRSGSSFPRPALADQIKRERDSASKDNDFIYHDRVPQVKDLAPVPADGGIGKLELKLPLLGSEVKDIFTELVPLGFLEVKNQTEAMRRSLIALELQRLREATNGLNSVMLSLNLPAAIQLNSSDPVPKSLLENAAKVRQLGGAGQLREHVYSLPDSAERNREILQQQKSTLDDEENTDNNLRQQFGDRWVRQPSRKLNEQWRQDIEKMFKFLEETKKTDQLLANRYEEQSEYFELLSKSDDEIREAIKSQQSDSCSSPTGSEAARQQLAAICSQIETLKADRNSLQDQLQEFQLPSEVLDRFLRTYQETHQVTEQEIANALNSELVGIRECVRASETKQEELLSDLQTKFEAFFGRKSATESSSLITRLNAAVDAFFALDKDVKEGMKFYAELTERCLKVQEKIDDFCLARTTEKTEHMADITTNLSRVTIANNTPSPPTPASVAPPARPPPTYSEQPAPPVSTAPTPAQPVPAAAPMPSMPYGEPGSAWGVHPYGFGYPPRPPTYMPYAMPAYGPPAGMPMYGYYGGFAPMNMNQMPPLPSYPTMPCQPGPYTPGQPRPPQSQQ